MTAPTGKPPPAALDNSLLTVKEVYFFPVSDAIISCTCILSRSCASPLQLHNLYIQGTAFLSVLLTLLPSARAVWDLLQEGQGAVGHITLLPPVVDTLHSPAQPLD